MNGSSNLRNQRRNWYQKQYSHRIRSLSSDSGCDVQCESLDKEVGDMNSILFTWKENLIKVVQQEVDRAEKMTQRTFIKQTERQENNSFNEY